MAQKDMKGYWKLFGVLVFALLVYMTYPFLEGIVYAIFLYYLAKPIKKQLDKKIESKEITSFIAIITLLSLIVIPTMVSTIYIADTVSKSFPFLIELIENILPQESSEHINELVSSIKILDVNYFLELVRSRDIQSIVLEPLKRLTEVFLWYLLIMFIAFVVGFYFLMALTLVG